ncbi:hypothetical protein CTI12_AA084840 [Artemisia annua]|uniref:Cytochrome P450 n=1 Tax=Artemisia annua TaxID=35608 RepID=A0A2U1Q1P2_ARTAN|nr:hypothetical protein CTI12_AA084840 [Artemisia annua]
MVDLIYAIFLSLIVVLVPFSLHFVFYKSKPVVDRKLPPGQTGWQVIGETLEFLANGWKGHPEKFIFDRMARLSPDVFKTSLMLEDAAVFLEKILPSAGETMNKRKMISSSFRPESLRQYVPVMDMKAQRLFKTKWDGPNGQFIAEADIADLIIGLLIGGDGNASLNMRIHCKNNRKSQNLKHPGELLNWEHLSKMKYSWNVACEVLRLAPPLQGSFREAITDFVYNGYSIPKGWKLYWSALSTHKNLEVFPEPQKLDPSRFDGKGPAPYTFVPFGGGPHICPGREYARLEILVFMHHLVIKYKWEKVILNEKSLSTRCLSLPRDFRFTFILVMHDFVRKGS